MYSIRSLFHQTFYILYRHYINKKENISWMPIWVQLSTIQKLVVGNSVCDRASSTEGSLDEAMECFVVFKFYWFSLVPISIGICFFWVKPKDIRKNFFKLHYLLLSPQVLGLIPKKGWTKIQPSTILNYLY